VPNPEASRASLGVQLVWKPDTVIDVRGLHCVSTAICTGRVPSTDEQLPAVDKEVGSLDKASGLACEQNGRADEFFEATTSTWNVNCLGIAARTIRI
jgi:hypothetical protein